MCRRTQTHMCSTVVRFFLHSVNMAARVCVCVNQGIHRSTCLPCCVNNSKCLMFTVIGGIMDAVIIQYVQGQIVLQRVRLRDRWRL